jgi:2-amino-4-hydroxy-6-hydroxymethyldihydropteridine diphosphokinase
MDGSGAPAPGAEVAYIALGSNLGDRGAFLAAARTALAALPGSEVVSTSDVEETAPIGPVDQPPYLNQMVALRTSLEPSALMERLQEIERANGRVRVQRWGPRTLDLDIVRFGDRRIDTPALVVPHPELQHRAFWQREVEQLDGLLRAGVRG